MTKVYSSTKGFIKTTTSTYQRFIKAHISLGDDYKSASNKWKLLNCIILNESRIKTYA